MCLVSCPRAPFGSRLLRVQAVCLKPRDAPSSSRGRGGWGACSGWSAAQIAGQRSPRDQRKGHGEGQGEAVDDERPQTPLFRNGPRGGGQWRRASWDEALDYVADGLRETIETFGGRGIALPDRGGPFVDLTRTFLAAFDSPNYFNHDATGGGNVHNAAIATCGFSHAGLVPDFPRVRHLVLCGRNIVEPLMVKEAQALMGALAGGMKCTYLDPRASLTACKAPRYWQVRPNSDYALNLALLHEVLAREAYDRAFVERHVSGMDALREAVAATTPEWQESHTGVPRRSSARSSRRSPPVRPRSSSTPAG